MLSTSGSSWQLNLFRECHYTQYIPIIQYTYKSCIDGEVQRGAAEANLGSNLSKSFTLVHWNGVNWLLRVAKLAEGRAVDSELLDNLVSVSDCASALLVWWRSGFTLTLFQPLVSEFSAFQMPVCKWTHGTSVLMATWADRASFEGVLLSIFVVLITADV